MLSITLHDGAHAFRFQLEGELVESVVPELEGSWQTAASTFGGRSVMVDFTRVTFVDEAGEALLRRMNREGAQFVARSDYQRDLLQEITGAPVGIKPPRKQGILCRLISMLRIPCSSQ